ncbi:MAG TPA: rhodanese-like domain-containing protein [Kineosporiaceae bacterium]|nr:rhodanese-like domain-containing protein [Kineosporiaceae bacterium]
MGRYLRTAGAVLLAGGLVFGTTGCSGASSGGSGTAVQAGAHLGVSEFAQLAGTPGTVVLDVRTSAEFATGHLAGAVNLDVDSADFGQRLSALDHHASYAVYCHSGRRSGMALQQMQSAGFTHVADLSGGVTAWTSAGRQLTSGS